MKKPTRPKIVFVYNADSGVFNLLTDIAHKMLAPQTYACNLCALTHSNFGMKKEWKTFLETLENPLEFLHADEFRKKHDSEIAALPAVFLEKNGALAAIADAREINEIRSLEELKSLIAERAVSDKG